MSLRPCKIVIIGIVSGVLQGQPLSFGVKAGVPFNDAVEGSFGVHSEEPRYTIGPAIELRLPLSFAAEVSALYRRIGYGAIDGAFGITSTTRVRANSWEFPLLIKYYLPEAAGPLRPFVEGGYVARRVFNAEGVVHNFGRDIVTGAPVDSTFPLNSSFLVRDNPTHGVTVGGGVRIGAGPLHVSPEIRYTRWTGRAFDQQGSRGFFAQSTENQAEFLLGLTF